jgi:acyl-coenzyme A synthetase/AMP-(fatty) acid ligase
LNLVEAILFQCASQPGAPAFCGVGKDPVTYGSLGRQINNMARRVRAAGLAPGNLAGLLIESRVLQAIVQLGLSAAGVVPIWLGGRKLPPGLKLDAILSDLGSPHPNYPDSIPNIELDFSWTMGDGKRLELVERSDEDLAVVTLTSGTTGEPRAVGMTNRIAAERVQQCDYIFGPVTPMCSRTFLNMGIGSAFTQRFLNYTLVRGGMAIFPDPNVGPTLAALQAHHAQKMITTPIGLASFAEDCERRGARPESLRVIISAGSVLTKTLADRVVRNVCPNLVSGYGSTEAGIVATASADLIAAVPGAVGRVTPGSRVEIVDERDNPLPPGTEGIVRLSGRYQVDGYLGDPEGSARVFRGGWSYPADFGAMNQDGVLILSGRQSDVLNIGGDKVNAERIEQVLASFAGILEAAAFNTLGARGTEEIWALVKCRSVLNEEALWTHCRGKLPVQFIPRKFISIEALPRNEMGKIERQKLPELAAAH